jgi:hypothetical protein
MDIAAFRVLFKLGPALATGNCGQSVLPDAALSAIKNQLIHNMAAAYILRTISHKAN